MLDGGQLKAKNKLRGVMAVLIEQRRQDREWDEREMAVRYQRATHKCQREANHRAMRDSAAIRIPATNLSKEDNNAVPTKLSQLSLVVPQTLLCRAA